MVHSRYIAAAFSFQTIKCIFFDCFVLEGITVNTSLEDLCTCVSPSGSEFLSTDMKYRSVKIITKRKSPLVSTGLFTLLEEEEN